jgi:transcription-repair coupling factor (superfamily II helicase)
LRAIEEFSELGAGFRLAMRDMEIRGAGNFLGPEQSGHVNMIGYDLYTQMLREAIADLRGEERPAERVPVRLDVELDAYLPESYIADPDQRISFYKRLADLADADALSSLSAELRDRYGRLPEPARNLVRLKGVRLLAESGGVEQLRIRGSEATLRFAAGREPGPEVVTEMVRDTPADLSFQADGREGLRILLRAREGHDAWEAAEALLRATGASDTLHVSHVSTEWEE